MSSSLERVLQLLTDKVQISVKESWSQQNITHEILFIFTSELVFV